jgi:hypothetical protein
VLRRSSERAPGVGGDVAVQVGAGEGHGQAPAGMRGAPGGDGGGRTAGVQGDHRLVAAALRSGQA